MNRKLFACRNVSWTRVQLLAALCAVVSCNFLRAQEKTEEAPAASNSAEQIRSRGEALYRSSCADCHGSEGQGEESVYEQPLEGDDSVGQLAQLIADTMPEGSPQECVDDDAQAVAEYIHYAFYSEAAQIRNRPPREMLTRLTGNQLRQSVSDLFARFYGLPDFSEARGVRADYYNGSSKRDNKKFERIDPVIDFDFGRESPGEGIEAKEFTILWEGGVLAEQSGRYEIIVRSSCSFVMDFGNDGREFINNHVQSGDKTEFRRSVQLTAGRVYPFHIRFSQRKRKTEIPPARISLSWRPPGHAEGIIPNRNLVAEWVPPTYALQSMVPPDDRTYGYERGISVSPEWDASTTAAAVEFAQVAFDELWPNYRRRHRKEDLSEREHLNRFLVELVETAFRSPLSDSERNRYVEKHLAAVPDDAEAVKRVVLLTLKSPRFLYPLADQNHSASLRTANRLALILFDSLPTDNWLRKDAIADKFASESLVRAYAERHVDDFRVRAKTRHLLYAWLNLEHWGEITKDQEQFGDFDERLVSDLRASLDVFLDSVVWSPASDYRQLFLSKTSFTTDRIAEYYGDHWGPVEGSDSSAGEVRMTEPFEPCHGVLSHPLLMSGLAYHDSTSPIHRGVFTIRYLLGRTLRPPADAFAPLSPDLHPELTTRERVALQTSPDSCQICHSKINALGFAFENYDAVGAFRATERDKPIDARGAYTTRHDEKVEFSGLGDLAHFVAESDDAHRAFVARAFQHFVKQPPAAFGADTLDRLTAKFRENGCSIRQLIIEIAVIGTRPVLPSDDKHVASK